jgi:hypothetical protein
MEARKAVGDRFGGRTKIEWQQATCERTEPVKVTDTAPGPTPSTADEEEEVNAEVAKAYEEFRERASIGDVQFLVRIWPAWIISPKLKEVVPVSRVYVGDMSGNLLFSRPVVLSGLIDLMYEFAQGLLSDVSRLNDLGYNLDMPVYAADVRERLKLARSYLEKSSELLESLNDARDKRATPEEVPQPPPKVS